MQLTNLSSSLIDKVFLEVRNRKLALTALMIRCKLHVSICGYVVIYQMVSFALDRRENCQFVTFGCVTVDI